MSKDKNRNKIYNSNYYLINKEKIQNRHRNYYLINKDKIKIHTKNYSLNNQDKIQKRSKIYYLKNKEKIKEQTKKYIEKCKSLGIKFPSYGKYCIKKRLEYIKSINYKYEKTPEQREIRSIKRSTRYYYPLKDKNCILCNNKAEIHHHITKPILIHKFVYGCKQCHPFLDKYMTVNLMEVKK